MRWNLPLLIACEESVISTEREFVGAGCCTTGYRQDGVSNRGKNAKGVHIRPAEKGMGQVEVVIEEIGVEIVDDLFHCLSGRGGGSIRARESGRLGLEVPLHYEKIIRYVVRSILRFYFFRPPNDCGKAQVTGEIVSDTHYRINATFISERFVCLPKMLLMLFLGLLLNKDDSLFMFSELFLSF